MTTPTAIYTLSLHDALPIFALAISWAFCIFSRLGPDSFNVELSSSLIHLPIQNSNISEEEDRKSTRLNSSHVESSYAVFCLKKKKRGRRQRSSSPCGSCVRG